MSDKLDTPGCAYLCGCSGTLPFDDFGLSQTVTGQGAATEQDFERCIAGAPSNFAGLPPVAQDESTNYYFWCRPLSLHAGGLIQSDGLRTKFTCLWSYIVTVMRQRNTVLIFARRRNASRATYYPCWRYENR